MYRWGGECHAQVMAPEQPSFRETLRWEDTQGRPRRAAWSSAQRQLEEKAR